MLGFVDYAITEVGGYKTPFIRIIEEYISDKHGDFVELLRAYKRGEKLQVKKTSMNKKFDFGTEKEYNLAVDMLDNIGKYDSNTEIVKLKKYRGIIESKESIAREKYNKEGTMAFNLSILLGIVIMIIIA